MQLIVLVLFICDVCVGKELGGSGYNESSTVKVEAVAKTAKGTIVSAPKYKGDASKVECKGMGLKKSFPGRPSVFSIDCAQAGKSFSFKSLRFDLKFFSDQDWLDRVIF